MERLPEGAGVVIDKNDTRTILLYYIDGKPWTYLADSLIDYNGESITGNIYKAKVINTYVQGTAFLDVGIEQDVMIPNRKYVDGDYVMVQAVNDDHDQKTYKASTVITLNSMLLVLCPNEKTEINYSQKFTPSQKNRLKSYENELLRIIAQELGSARLILRTIASKFDFDDILSELYGLIERWRIIKRKFQTQTKPGLIWQGETKEEIFRLNYMPFADYVITNSKDVVNLAEKLRIPDVRYVGEDEFISFSELIDKDYRELASGVVFLDDGKINLRFDYTESCTFIDVNSGAYHSSKSREDALLDINVKAAKEIARQISLRNIGGPILIDFITMRSEENNQKLIQCLRNETAKDRLKCKVFSEVTRLGMVEMIRARRFRRTDSDLIFTCPTCGGTGMVFSPKLEILKMMADTRLKLCSLYFGNKSKTLRISLSKDFEPNVTEYVREYLRGMFPNDTILFDVLPPENDNGAKYVFHWEI